MELEKIIPLVLYDNECYLCTKFAKVISKLSQNKILIVGHYTTIGEEIRKDILDASALDMFWFIDAKMAYGGRAGIFPLIKTIILPGAKNHSFQSIMESCDAECKTIKAVFVRSASLFTNSKKIKI